jgi:hypothetical protein
MRASSRLMDTARTPWLGWSSSDHGFAVRRTGFGVGVRMAWVNSDSTVDTEVVDNGAARFTGADSSRPFSAWASKCPRSPQ